MFLKIWNICWLCATLKGHKQKDCWTRLSSSCHNALVVLAQGFYYCCLRRRGGGCDLGGGLRSLSAHVNIYLQMFYGSVTVWSRWLSDISRLLPLCSVRAAASSRLFSPSVLNKWNRIVWIEVKWLTQPVKSSPLSDLGLTVQLHCNKEKKKKGLCGVKNLKQAESWKSPLTSSFWILGVCLEPEKLKCFLKSKLTKIFHLVKRVSAEEVSPFCHIFMHVEHLVRSRCQATFLLVSAKPKRESWEMGLT